MLRSPKISTEPVINMSNTSYSIFTMLCTLITKKCNGRFREEEVRNSVAQVSYRWHHVLSEEEKKKAARIIGGNRYALSTYALLDHLFEEVVEEKRG